LAKSDVSRPFAAIESPHNRPPRFSTARFPKGQYVKVEDAELEAREAEANASIDMREFIPIEKIDPIYFESSYWLVVSVLWPFFGKYFRLKALVFQKCLILDRRCSLPAIDNV
jgi:hypothetical protein